MSIIRVVSDLHLEFDNKIADFPKSKDDIQTILILAGDISTTVFKLWKFIKMVSPRFKRVIFIAGNHEYYNTAVEYAAEEYNVVLSQFPNVSFNVNDVGAYTCDGFLFVFCTLWGYTDDVDSPSHNNINDFRTIAGWTPTKMNEKNILERTKIEKILKSNDNKLEIVMITHHIPLSELVLDEFKELDNSTYVGQCKDIIAKYKIHTWIFGHTHSRTDRIINGTRYISNARGYPHEDTGYDAEFSTVLQSGSKQVHSVVSSHPPLNIDEI